MQIAVVPYPKTVIPGDGEFVINRQTRISAAEGTEKIAAFIAERLRAATGHAMPIITAGQSPAGTNVIVLTRTGSPNPSDASYTLDVASDQVHMEAVSERGLFYAAQTLRQLLPPQIETGQVVSGDLHVPMVHIKDAPRFEWRGLMLDVSRHFFPVSFVKKLIDAMALYKLNVLHLHLTDDQGWRIEIKRYPRLTEIGSVRAATPIPPRGSNQIDGVPYRGFYTQDDIREIVAYAQSRFITVVPEIEMPGHAVAALTSYPDLGCVGKDYQVRIAWGIEADVLCAGKDSTFEFVENVLSEVIDLFPSEYIHVGGDECPKTRWEKCPHCQARIQQEGLKNEHELQSYFVRRVEKILEAKGRRLIGWDEILEGGLAPNATVMSWRGAEGGIEAASAGHHVVMSPNTHCYFDYYQAADGEGEPPGIGGYIPLSRVFEFNPSEGVPDDKAGFVLGGQGNLWTEYMGSESHVEYMAFPRALALAEALWSPNPRASYMGFLNRLESHLPRLEALGIHYRAPRPKE